MTENETPKATPDSSGAGEDANQSQSASKAPAVKDKECPYCHQPFTSSSLGRHLDQYLSKKKPDGIHDVDEIKRLRGGITRRQPKGTHAGKHESHEESSRHHDSPAPTHYSPSAEYLNGVSEAGHVTSLNTPIWQSTGVINGLPDPRVGNAGGAIQAINNTPTTLKRSTPAPTRETLPEKETARALELALREVLDNIKSASVRTAPKPSPFDFDLQAQTFPSLCLRLLPPPPTLFSSGPFSTPESFPIEPPGAGHLEPVRAKATSIIAQWKADQFSALKSKAQSSLPPDPARIESVARQHTEIATRHIEIAYHNWMKNESNIHRYEQWLTEVLRAFARECSERQEMAERLVRVQEETDQLQSQLDLLSKCQWPREFAFFPPCRGAVGSSLGAEGVRDLNTLAKPFYTIDSTPDSPWDYEAIVTKWKRIIREESARTAGAIAAQQQQQQHQQHPPLPHPHSPVDSSSHHPSHLHQVHTPHSHSHILSHSHPHPHHPRPSSAGSPSALSSSTVSSIPAAKRPKLSASAIATTTMPTPNGTHVLAGIEHAATSASTSSPRHGPGAGGGGAGASNSAGSGDRSISLSGVPPQLGPPTPAESGPMDAPFFGRRSLREVKF